MEIHIFFQIMKNAVHSLMWVNVNFCTFSEFTVVKIKNTNFGMLGSYLAIVSIAHPGGLGISDKC